MGRVDGSTEAFLACDVVADEAFRALDELVVPTDAVTEQLLDVVAEDVCAVIIDAFTDATLLRTSLAELTVHVVLNSKSVTLSTMICLSI